MSAIDRLLTTANNEVGYMEKSRAAYKADPVILDSKVKGAGADNLTKYARDTGHQNGEPWCQTFIAAIMLYTFGREKANSLLCGKLNSASTMAVKDAFKAQGRLVELAEARPGDIVYRSRTGGGHVGLVIGRTASGGIRSLEGNTTLNDPTSWNGGQVAIHSDGSWMWCARPDYGIVDKWNTGWHKTEGRWWYADTSCTYLKHTWQAINHHWYYFDDDGYIVTGDQMIDGKRYYFETSGDFEGAQMVTFDDHTLTYRWAD